MLLTITVISLFLILRKNEIDNFKSDIKWFVSVQDSFNNQNTKGHLKSLIQNKSVFLEVSNKHIDSIKNHNIDNSSPSINVFLNTAKIEFSWHYDATFVKSERGWEIQSCKEYPGRDGA